MVKGWLFTTQFNDTDQMAFLKTLWEIDKMLVGLTNIFSVSNKIF